MVSVFYWLSLPDPSGCNLICHAVQRLYGHNGKDVASSGVRPLLFRTPFVAVRLQDSAQHVLFHRVWQEVLKIKMKNKTYYLIGWKLKKE